MIAHIHGSIISGVQGHLFPPSELAALTVPHTMTTVHNLRYMVNYIASQDEPHAQELTMAHHLASASAQCRQWSWESQARLISMSKQTQGIGGENGQLSQALLALLMYTAITLGRSKEYCTLKFENLSVRGGQ